MRFYYQFSFVLGSQIHQHRVLEASWGCLEGVLGVFGASRGCLGTSWARLGVSWSVLEPSWSVLEPSWSRLGAVLKRLEAVCGALIRSDSPTTCQQRSEPPGSPPFRVGKTPPPPRSVAYPSFALSFPVLTFRLCFACCPGFSCPSNVIPGMLGKAFRYYKNSTFLALRYFKIRRENYK